MTHTTEKAERLYFVKPDYVQYNGRGEKPEELARYEEQHPGELAPFIPLPKGPVCFFPSSRHPLRWPGKGPLPEEVMEHVREWGVLPKSDSMATNEHHHLEHSASKFDDLDDDWEAEDWG